MIPLLSYALRKSLRERFVWIFLLAPLVCLTAPMAGMVAEAARSGTQSDEPFRLPTLTAAQSATAIFIWWTVLGAAVSAASAFWVFRADIANRSALQFVLAMRHSRLLPCAAAAFGFLLGLASSAIALPVPVVATAATLAIVVRAGAAIVSASALAALLGAAVAVAAPAPGNAIGAAAAGAVVAVVAFQMPFALFTVIALVVFGSIMFVVPHLLEKRCAS